MGFCYPGTGKGGDLQPRAECAPAWRTEILSALTQVELTLTIGRYALDWHMPAFQKHTVTDAVRQWRDTWPGRLALPHPSPRNNRWLKQNPWFEEEILPCLRKRVRDIL